MKRGEMTRRTLSRWLGDRIGPRARRLRRSLARAIAPAEPEPDPQIDIFIDLCGRGAAALRKLLPLSERDYMTAPGHVWADGKPYLLYTALDEVQKAAIHLRQLRDTLEGPPVSPGEDLASRLVVSQVLEEQIGRQRRLAEVLVVLVLCETTDEPGFYKDLLLLEDLDDHLGANADLKEFYSARSGNIGFWMQHQCDAIRALESELNLSRCWYRLRNEPLEPLDRLKAGRLLSSFRARLKCALPLMTPNERLVCGLSYSGYSHASESIHYNLNRHDYRLDAESNRASAVGVGLTGLAVVERVRRLLGGSDNALVQQITRCLQATQPTERVRRMTQGDIAVGDFVAANGYLGEVIGINESAYGYRSYRVRHLVERPLEHLEEDSYLPWHVKRLWTRDQFMNEMEQAAKDGTIPREAFENASKQPPERVQAFLREMLTTDWANDHSELAPLKRQLRGK